MPDWVISPGMWKEIFALGVPLLEKILRPAAVYVFLVFVIRSPAAWWARSRSWPSIIW